MNKNINKQVKKKNKKQDRNRLKVCVTHKVSWYYTKKPEPFDSKSFICFEILKWETKKAKELTKHLIRKHGR